MNVILIQNKNYIKNNDSLGFEPEDIIFPIAAPIPVLTPVPVQLSCERILHPGHPLFLEIFKREKAYVFWFSINSYSANTI